MGLFFCVIAVVSPFLGVITPEFVNVFKNMLVGVIIVLAVIAGYILAVAVSITKIFISTLTGLFFVGGCGLLLVFLAVIDVFLRYKNSGISVGDKNVVLSRGGFTKTLGIIKTISIESVTSRGSRLKRKAGLVSISLGYVASARAAHMTAYNLPAEQYEMLQGVLKY